MTVCKNCEEDENLLDNGDKCPNCGHKHYSSDDSGEESFGSTHSQEAFAEACRPLMKWINDNCHPHHIVVVHHTNAQLHEGQMSFNTDDYLGD